MITERIQNIIGNLLESSYRNLCEEYIFKRESKSVGTMRIAEVLEDDEHPGYDLVILDFPVPWFEDYSPFINHVPSGIFTRNQIAEIFVRNSIEPMDPEHCLVSLRPFKPTTYGKPFGWSEAKLNDIFAYNPKNSESSPRFFNKFF